MSAPTAEATGLTHVLMITDASGSMQPLAEDVRGGHNEYLDALLADGTADHIRITLTVFNTEVTVIETAVPVAKATRLDRTNYRPDGGTALLDAVGNTLRQFAKDIVLGKGDKVLVFIQTDGGENASREFGKEGVASLIAEQEQAGWAFTFSGTGPNGWASRGAVGMVHSSTSNTATSKGTRAAYRGRAAATVAYAAPSTEGEILRSANISGLVQAVIDEEDGAFKVHEETERKTRNSQPPWGRFSAVIVPP